MFLMKIAITGSSGLVGSALTARLRSSGHHVIEMHRGSEADPKAVWNPEQGWVREGALAGIDAVVNLGGASIGGGRWNDARKQVLRASRIDATRTLVEHLRSAGIRPSVFVQGSAVGYYGDRGDERLDESAESGDDFLATLSRDWEAEGRRASELGARVVLARTSFVVASGADAFKRLAMPVRLGVGGKLGSGRQWFPWIHLEDEVRALEFLLTSEVAGPVNLSSPETVTNTVVTKALGRVLKRPTFMPVPGFALKALLGEMADALLLSGQRVIPSVLSDAGFTWNHPTIESAVREATR
jgi:uncharacterized protein (TIGR01777 family)